MTERKRTDLRWLCAVLAVLGLVAWWTGLRAARDRQAMLLPSRLELPIQLPRDAWLEVDADATSSLLLALPEGWARRRLVLHQVFPERRLLRWLEPVGAEGALLLLPLRGLQPGEYWLSGSEDDATAGPVEMDRPVDALETVLRLRVRPLSATTPSGG